MPHVNNVSIHEDMFIHLFQQTTENSFQKQNHHEMKECSIPNPSLPLRWGGYKIYPSAPPFAISLSKLKV